MDVFQVTLARLVRYTARVTATDSAAAGTIIADLIRANENPLGRKYTIGGVPPVHVSDEGLGEIHIRRIEEDE